MKLTRRGPNSELIRRVLGLRLPLAVYSLSILRTSPRSLVCPRGHFLKPEPSLV